MKLVNFLGAAAAGTLLLAGCGKNDDAKTKQPPLMVTVATVAEREMAGALRASGRLLPREEAGVARLSPAELVREPELHEELGVPGRDPNLLLERGDGAGGDPARRAPERPLGERCRGGGRRPGRGRLGEDASDEPAEGERDRDRAAHDECRPASHAERRPSPYRCPVCS